MPEGWKKSQDILKDATLKSEKYRYKVQEILKEELTKENYKKIRNLLEKDASIRNKAIERSEKIRQKEIKKEDE